jgi:hypothetical protein
VAKGEPGCAFASFKSFAHSASQVTFTAVPTDAAVHEPPCKGDSGSIVSPSSKVTRSIGTPAASAATCVMIVYVPVPMSEVALDTVREPSTLSTARALAFCCMASHTPVATPQPISWCPSRIERGAALRRDHPKRSAPC